MDVLPTSRSGQTPSRASSRISDTTTQGAGSQPSPGDASLTALGKRLPCPASPSLLPNRPTRKGQIRPETASPTTLLSSRTLPFEVKETLLRSRPLVELKDTLG